MRRTAEKKGGRSRPGALGVVAFRLVLGRPLALGLRHLLGALGLILRHSLLFLMHALALHRAVTHHLAGGLLAASKQLVQESHCLSSLSENSEYRSSRSKK